jgi:hypothetical protein
MRSRTLWLGLALLLSAGCRHTRLTVTLKADGVQEQDFRRLIDLSDAPENQLVRKDRKVVIDFREDLEPSTRARLTRVLDIIKRSERRKDGPVFAWHVDALDAELAKSLGLAEHPARDYPIDLDVGSGRPGVGVATNGSEREQGMGRQYCFYEIPLRNALPEDAFTDSVVARKRESSVPGNLLERVRNEFGDLTSRDTDAASKHVVALDPELDPLTQHVLLEKRKTLVILFGEGKQLARLLWHLDPDEDFGVRDEAIAACYERIRGAREAFYRDLLFPDISGYVESYKFDRVRL